MCASTSVYVAVSQCRGHPDAIGVIWACVGGVGRLCAPHAATHVPLAPWGYATTSSVLAACFAGSFDRFATPSAAYRRRALHQGGSAHDPKGHPIPIRHAAGDAVPRARCRPRGGEFPRASPRPAAGAHLLRGEGQPGRAGAGAACPRRQFLRRRELRGGRGLPEGGRGARGDQLRQHHQEGVRHPRRPSRPASICSPSTSSRSWRSSPARRRARGSIAASWSATRAPTGRCRANSAPPSRRRRR